MHRQINRWICFCVYLSLLLGSCKATKQTISLRALQSPASPYLRLFSDGTFVYRYDCCSDLIGHFYRGGGTYHYTKDSLQLSFLPMREIPTNRCVVKTHAVSTDRDSITISYTLKDSLWQLDVV